MCNLALSWIAIGGFLVIKVISVPICSKYETVVTTDRHNWNKSDYAYFAYFDITFCGEWGALLIKSAAVGDIAKLFTCFFLYQLPYLLSNSVTNNIKSVKVHNEILKPEANPNSVGLLLLWAGSFKFGRDN